LSRFLDSPQSSKIRDGFLGCVDEFDEYFDFVHHALRRRGIAQSDAEDLAQEVFLVAWRHWDEFDRKRPLRPWLAGIVFRLAYNHRHRVTREVPRGTLDFASDERPGPEQQIDAFRERTLVVHALASLPEKARALIIAHDLDGVPTRAIAESLAVPLFTVHSRLRAARAAFAKALRRLRNISAIRGDAGRAAASSPAIRQIKRWHVQWPGMP
jgi:RNA polymerase sigma-70 factor (ECF subfamily)